MKIQGAEFIRSCSTLDDCPSNGLPEIALVGRSNVGKSSLLNCLLQRKGLAKTSRTPGKTRLINFFRVTMNLKRPLRFYLVDLPGYGYADVSMAQQEAWGRLVERYLIDRPTLQRLIVLLDIRRIPGSLDHQLMQWIGTYRTPILLVVTKSDQIPRGRQAQALEQIRASLPSNVSNKDIHLFSSKTGQGRDSLLTHIVQILQNEPGENGQFSSRQ
jgi:GTP-binding protein